MKKHKLILFDWGNIVESCSMESYSCKDAWIDLFKSLGYSKDKSVFERLHVYKVSQITSISEFEKTYEIMKEDFNLSGNFKDFVDQYYLYFNNIRYFKDVIDFEISLKDECYIGILSNLTLFDKESLDREVGLKNYDYTFLSFELGAKKPSLDIFEKVQEKIDFDKKDILFIDDRQDNIEAAKRFGWNTFIADHTKLESIKEICMKFLED